MIKRNPKHFPDALIYDIAKKYHMTIDHGEETVVKCRDILKKGTHLKVLICEILDEIDPIKIQPSFNWRQDEPDRHRAILAKWGEETPVIVKWTYPPSYSSDEDHSWHLIDGRSWGSRMHYSYNDPDYWCYIPNIKPVVYDKNNMGYNYKEQYQGIRDCNRTSIIYCTEKEKCTWQGAVLTEGLGWGKLDGSVWEDTHNKECKGKLICLKLLLMLRSGLCTATLAVISSMSTTP